MKVAGFMPQKPVEIEVTTKNASEAVRCFKEKHPDATVDNIDGQLVLGLCESCAEPIMDEEDVQAHYLGEDNIYICYGCKPPEGKTS